MNTIKEYRKALEILKDLTREREGKNIRVSASWHGGILTYHFQNAGFAYEFTSELRHADIDCLSQVKIDGESTVTIQ